MFKNIAAAVGSILLLVLTIISVFLSSFEEPTVLAQKNSFALSEKTEGLLVLPEALTFVTPEKDIEIQKKEFSGWLKKIEITNAPDPQSLPNYFYQQTGNWPLWTNIPSSAILKSLAWDEQRLGKYLLELEGQINQHPQEAELLLENGRALKFTPQRLGVTLDLAESKKLLEQGLLLGKAGKIILSVSTTEPRTKLSDLNNLGLSELLATGQTDFSGSSSSRIQNIKVGASQYNGVIIGPSEEFSFNKYLGPIDAKHGYQPELVIKPEGATPEFGGGLCQVSTTAFRAAFFAGLPITARRNHSYAVRYYEWIADDQPRAVGLDATIYSGAQDMKFVNDTKGAILIWTRVEGKRLYFDFYGTHDGREVLVDGPHPYDRRNSGAVKSKVTRIVKKPGQEPVELTYDSRYVPPKTLPAVVEYPKVQPPADFGASPKPAESSPPLSQ